MNRSNVRRAAVIVVLALVSALAVAAAPAPAGAGPSATWTAVSAGYYHTCGIQSDASLFCWGSNERGALGRPSVAFTSPIPGEVDGNHADWIDVSAGGLHTCGIRIPGSLWCWGSDEYGQLGDGSPNGNPLVDTAVPVQVAGGFNDWQDVSAGSEHTCARRVTGQLYCFGRDAEGQLGNGAPLARRTTPGLVATLFTDWVRLSGSGYHTCARRATGRLYCWGADFDGRLGNGGPTSPGTDRPSPVQVAGGLTTWAEVGAGHSTTCATGTAGRLFCWGADFYGQLGNGGPTPGRDRSAPVLVNSLFTDWVGVTAGSAHGCAIRATQRVQCWGLDDAGQVGNGPPNNDRNSPVQVAGGITDWVLVEAGGFHTCGLRATGELRCWGQDGGGQLGNDSPHTSRSSPSLVPV